MIKDLELRQFEDLEIRIIERELDGEKRQAIGGLAIPFNKASQDLGYFIEIIPDRVRIDYWQDDVFSLKNHNWDFVLGRMTAGTMEVDRRDDGVYSVTYPPTNSDILESIDRGDIRSQSFGFLALESTWDATSEVFIRYIEHMMLAETSAVPLPAYRDTDISVAMRSLEQFKNEEVEAVREVIDYQSKKRWLELMETPAWMKNKES